MSPILWLTLWIAAGFQIRQPPPARASIQGVVIRAGAAAGAQQRLPDAKLELKPGNISVTSGADGAFTFRNLLPGRYTITVTRAGYIPQVDPSHGITASGMNVTVAASQNLKDISLPMVPAPVITGTVFGPHGGPLAAGLVQAYTRQYTPIGTRLKIVKGAMTNDMGEFRLFGLNFGAYFVSGGYSDRDRAVAIGGTQLSANVSKADDGYATTFFDGAEELSRARPVLLVPGADPPSVSIFLKDSERFKIRGQVLPIPVPSGTKIVLAPKGADLTDAAYSVEPNASGAFEIRALSPGAYLLLGTAENGALSSDVIALNLTDRDIDGFIVALQQTMLVTGAITGDRNQRLTLDGIHVKLSRATIEFDQTVDARPNQSGIFNLQNVMPTARYDVLVQSLPPDMYVKSITSGGRNILQGNASLLPQQPLQITLATAIDNIDVHVTKGNDPAAGAEVVLIPDALLQRRQDRYITGYTDESGEVQLTAVPPGRYTAYAFEKIDDGAYYVFAYDPPAANRFRDRAMTVIVGESGPKEIQLRVIPAAETAGGLQ